MSQALKLFLEAWNSHHSAARLIEDEISLPSPEEATAYLETLSSSEREQTAIQLTDAMIALEKNLVILKTEQNHIKRQLEQSKKVSQACQSYARTPQKTDLSE